MVDTILSTSEFSNSLREECALSKKSIRFYSAFIKQDAIEWLAENIDDGIDVNVICRWRFADIKSRVSDLSVYNYCKSNNWKFGVDLNLHAKIYIFDETRVLIGSSNITKSAFGLRSDSNVEFGAAIQPEVTDLAKLNKIEDGAVWLNDELFQLIDSHTKSNTDNDNNINSLEWPTELMRELSKPIDVLWVSDFPQNSSPLAEGEGHDNHAIKQQFLGSRVYLWLIRELREAAPDQYTNFGWLTSRIQYALVDDPKPYRKEIKEYVSIIFDWVKKYGNDDIEIIQHQRTMSLRLKK